MLFAIATSCLSSKCSGLPSLYPLAFFACNDALVLDAINSASYCEIAEIICRTILFACGKSQKTISTSDSRRLERNDTDLASRSSFATIRVAPSCLHRDNSSFSLGLSDLRPLSTSTYSAIGAVSRWLPMISLCASSPTRNSLFLCAYSKISYILCLVLHILNEFNISSRDKTNI